MFLAKVLGPVPKGSAIHVDAKFIMEKMGSPPKIYGASFAGAYGTEGTKLAVNAQLELPINQEVSDPFTVGILSLNIFLKTKHMLKIAGYFFHSDSYALKEAETIRDYLPWTDVL